MYSNHKLINTIQSNFIKHNTMIKSSNSNQFKGTRITNPREIQIDGCLPDFDYSEMRMKNLDELNDEKVLMEFETVEINRSSFKNDLNIKLVTNNNVNSKDIVEDVFIELSISDNDTSKTGNHIKPGDQLLQIDGVAIRNLKQAYELIQRCGNTITLLVVRPVKIINLNIPQLSSISKSNLNLTTESDQRINESNSNLFPHIVYTTSDRLIQTIWLQQNLFQEKLNLLSKSTQPKLSSTNLDNFSNRKEIITKLSPMNSQNSLIHKTNVKFDKEFTIHGSSWVIRRSSDGTRYITKKLRRSDHIINKYNQNGLSSHSQQIDKIEETNLQLQQNTSDCDKSDQQNQAKSRSTSETRSELKDIQHNRTKKQTDLDKNTKETFKLSSNNNTNNYINNQDDISSKIPIVKRRNKLPDVEHRINPTIIIPTSILIKPPLLFKRSHSANMTRLNNLINSNGNEQKENLNHQQQIQHHARSHNPIRQNFRDYKMNSPESKQALFSVVTI